MDFKALSKFMAQARDKFKSVFLQQLHEAGVTEDLSSAIQPAVQQALQHRKEKCLDELAEVLGFTWFHRLAVIRYLELNQRLSHGVRVLSSETDATGFHVLDCIDDYFDSFGLDKKTVIELKLAADKDDELLRLVLLGQCQQLSAAMPFLFNSDVGLEELLLPMALTRTDSLVRFMVDALPEPCWQSTFIFAVMFNDYYANLKKELPKKIGYNELAKVTQTVEPEWVSQYMLENTLSRRWQELHPTSKIAASSRYYLNANEQPDTVKQYLDNLANNAADPRQLTVLDPACGSGQLLVQAYAILKRIYLENGYQLRDIPQHIFEHNLTGLDICARAMQCAEIRLVLCAIEDDRRYLSRPVTLKLFNLRDGDVAELSNKAFARDVQALGSLAPAAAETDSQDKYQVFNRQFDVVVCYPPNLGIIGAADSLGPLKQLAKTDYASTKSNLATMFFSRCLQWLKPDGLMSVILKDSWLFLSRYEQMRDVLFTQYSLTALAHFARNVIPEQHQMNAAVIRNAAQPDYLATFCFIDSQGLISKNEVGESILPVPKSFPPVNNRYVDNSLSRMKIVPTKPLSYWLSEDYQGVFKSGKPLSSAVETKACGKIADRSQDCRYWWELSTQQGIGDQAYWKPLATGGSFRRWYGNCNLRIKQDKADSLGLATTGNQRLNSWTAMAPVFNAREIDQETYFDSSGPCFGLTITEQQRWHLLGVFNSSLFDTLVKAVYPEGVLGSIRPADLAAIPICDEGWQNIAEHVKQLVDLSRADWCTAENAIGFEKPALLHSMGYQLQTGQEYLLAACYQYVRTTQLDTVIAAQQLEQQINADVNVSYGLAAETNAAVPLYAVSLLQNPFLHTDVAAINDTTEHMSKALDLHQAEQVIQLISYIIGCLMGRFSAASSGVILDHDVIEQFERFKSEHVYQNSPLDQDGIVPLASEAWLYPDDATAQISLFVKQLFGQASFDQNMLFISASLKLKYPDLTDKADFDSVIRTYMEKYFFKDHCRQYERKPIYWLFSSGKERAFQCLIYLHRMNEATLSRLRVEYVVPHLVRYESQLDLLSEQKLDASPTQLRNIEKQVITLEKKQTELRAFDEQLKHHADMRIKLDLDDGVKVNYGKFGNLLAEVKAVTGDKGE